MLSPRDRVVDDIVRGLYDGKFKPGQRLVEAQLTDRYDISRGPVREALNRLSVMGIVELAPQRGAQIRVLSVREAIDSLIVAQELVGLAARLAAERSGVDKTLLQRTVRKLAQFDQTAGGSEYGMARDAFYAALNKLAGNNALNRMMMQVHIHLIRVQFRSAFPAVDRRRHRDYIRIADAVLAGDAKKAERAARAHLGRSITAMRALEADHRDS